MERGERLLLELMRKVHRGEITPEIAARRFLGERGNAEPSGPPSNP